MNKAKIATAIVLLLLSSTLVILPHSTGVSGQTPSSLFSGRVNPVTGKPYGDPLQYEWPRGAGVWSQGNDPVGNTKSSGGPAPNTPEILWSMDQAPLTARDDLGQVTWGLPDMFVAGYVIIRSTKNNVSYVNALDPYTTALVYQIRNPSNAAPAKIDDEHFRLTIPTNQGGGWMIFKSKTGQWVTNTTDAPGGTIIPEYHIVRQEGTGLNTTTRWIAAFDISNIISTGKAPLIWNISVGTALSALCAGGGMLFYGSWYDTRIFAVNATDGTIAWEIYTKETTRDAIYYNGKLYHHGLARGIRTYNGTTGELVWEWQGGLRTYFANTGTAGDGMFFALGVDVPRGFVGAWDDETGELLWKVEGAYYIGYHSPVYDDGKVYTILYDGQGLSSMGLTEVPKKSVCIDAITGQILWEMPYNLGAARAGDVAQAGGFRSDVAIAYGILYFEHNRVLYAVSDIEPKDWSSFRGNYDLPGVGQGGPGAGSYVKWAYQTEGPVTSCPAIVNGTVYIGSQDRNYYALDADTGKKIWNFTTGYRVLSSPAISNGVLYTGADDGNIYALNAKTGSQIWAKNVGGRWEGLLDYGVLPTNQPRSSPIIINNRLYVGALDGKVYSLNTVDGNIIWSYQTRGPILGSPAHHDGVIYIASTDINIGPNGTLYALSAANGALVWASQVPESGGTGTGPDRAAPASTPIVVSGARSNTSANARVFDMILIGNNGPEYGNKYVVGYNLDGTRARFPNGTLYRLFSTQGPRGSAQTIVPVYFNGTVYGASNLRAVAWNVTDGKVLWETWMVHNTYSSPALSITVEAAKVYIGSDTGSIHVLDAATGETLYSHHTYGVIASSPAIWNGRMYVGGGDGYVYAFDDKKTIPTSIHAEANHGLEMWNNETITFTGRLNTTEQFYVQAEPTVGTGEINEIFYPGIPNAKITISLQTPSSTPVTLTATTDRKGNFNASYNPTVAGSWSWQAEYAGQEFPGESFSYSPAQSDTGTITVTTPPTPPPPEEPTPPTIPVEYIYTALAAVVIAIVAVGAYAYTKRRKK